MHFSTTVRHWPSSPRVYPKEIHTSFIIDEAFSRRFFVLGQPAVEEEWTRDGVMRESKQFRDIILVGNVNTMI